MYADGRQHWPEIQLDFEAFARHCVDVLGPDPDHEVQRNGADLFLSCACAARDPLAIAAFERETTQAARAAIARIRSNPGFVDETLHALYDKLLLAPDAKVAEYSGHGSLVAWTRVAAVRAAIDTLRARRLEWTRRADLSEHLCAHDPAPETRLTRAEYAPAFQRAIKTALSALSAQDRNLLRMHVVGHCSIDQIGRIHGVHRATAARWLERIRQQLLKSVRRQMRLTHGRLTDSEFLSIAEALKSEIELSFSADFAASPRPSASAT